MPGEAKGRVAVRWLEDQPGFVRVVVSAEGE